MSGMSTLNIILGTILIVVDLFLIVVVLSQSAKRPGLSGSIAGGAETFFGKNKAKSYEGKLAFWTKVSAIGFIVITILMLLAQKLG